MSSLTLFFIRHAEKPDGAWPGPGLTVEGSPDKKSLVLRGWQRAGAWSALFGSAPQAGDYQRPRQIFAAAPEEDNLPNPSKRPFQTVLPLSQKLALEPIIDFPRGEEERLAKQLTLLSDVALVCWEHKSLVEALLPAVVGGERLPGLPSCWDDTRFDVVLRLDRASSDSRWIVRQLFPRLLSGDSDMPL